MNRSGRPRRSTHPLSLALCGGILVTGIFTAAPAAASMPMPVPPTGFGGPGGCTTVTSDGATDLTMRVQHVSPEGGGAISYPLLHIPHP